MVRCCLFQEPLKEKKGCYAVFSGVVLLPEKTPGSLKVFSFMNELLGFCSRKFGYPLRDSNPCLRHEKAMS